MEYNWDKEKIEKLKKEYMDLKRHTKGLTKEDKIAINNKLKLIKEMLDILCPSKEKYFSFSLPTKYMDKAKYLPKRTWKDYQEIPEYIHNWILNSVQILQNYEDLADKQELPDFLLSDKELVELSHDFFRWLPNKNYVQIADKYMDKKENLLRIQNASFNSDFGNTYPFSYPLYIPYFLINRENTINDFCTLNHELAHGMFYASDTSISLASNHQYILELEGNFFDFLSLEFLKEKEIVSQEAIHKLDSNEFLEMLDSSIIDFYFQYLGISLYSKHKRIRITDISQNLLEQQVPFYINETLLLFYLQEDSKELARYALSFLTSLDLEKLYTQDKELAFREFEAIRYNKTNDIEKNLTNHGITFMQDGYQNLHEKIRKLSLIKD